MARAVARLAADGLIPTVFRPCVSFFFLATRLFSYFLIIGLRLVDPQCTPFQVDRDYKSLYGVQLDRSVEFLLIF